MNSYWPPVKSKISPWTNPMAQRYIYNEQTCAFEPYALKGKALRNRIIGVFSFSFVLAVTCYILYVQKTEPWDVQLAQQENQSRKAQWESVRLAMAENQKKLQHYSKEDDQNYRVILDVPPLSLQERQAGVGGANRIPDELWRESTMFSLVSDLQQLQHELSVQQESFDELQKLVNRKQKQWSSRPAIQPIDNKNLVLLYRTFGLRLNPVLGYVRPHKGLDFKADRGTPIYATGDGTIIEAYYSDSYGNVVFVDHGFDFETRYAHMLRFIVRKGEKVKRGQVVGYVGSTGTSGGDHLHYEVLYKGIHINPINFFQLDLSNKEYEKLIEIAKRENPPLD
jgi:murein DD-endopeptidase MepM/ murein hydrolase activator NlpD